MLSKQESTLTTGLKSLSDLLKRPEVDLQASGSLLANWGKALSEADFPFVIIDSASSKNRILNHLFQSPNEKDNWAGSPIRFLDLNLDEELSPESKTLLQNAKGFLLVVDARRVFSQQERAHLAAILGQRDPRQLFIAVNNIQSVEEVDEVKAWVRKVLEPYFVDAQGLFNEDLYQTHVFFVDRKHPPSFESLQSQLIRFFKDPEERINSALAASVQVSALAVGTAQEYIHKKIIEQQKTLDDLASKQKKLYLEQQELQGKKKEFNWKVEEISERICVKVHSSLLRHLEKMYSQWDDDSQSTFQWEELATPMLLRSLISQETLETLELTINRRAQEYLREEFNTWINTLPEEIQPELENLVQFQEQSFNLRLLSLNSAFASSRYQSLDQVKIRQTLQKMVQNVAFGGRRIDQSLVRLLLRAVFAYLIIFSHSILIRLGGGVGLLGTEALGIESEAKKIREDLSHQVRDSLLQNLRHAILTSELTEMSFRDLDTFLQRLARHDMALLDALYQELPENYQTLLSSQSLNEEQREDLIGALNNGLSTLDSKNQKLLEGLDASHETISLLAKGTDSARAFRLLLADVFPDEVHANLYDLLFTNIEYQMAQFLGETREFMDREDSASKSTLDQELAHTVTTEQSISAHLHQLQEISKQIQEKFDHISVTIYGKPFTDDELRSIMPHKKTFFGDLLSKEQK